MVSQEVVKTKKTLTCNLLKSSTTGKAGGLKDPEQLKAVINLEPPKGDCLAKK
jgi:hypothetical protein